MCCLVVNCNAFICAVTGDCGYCFLGFPVGINQNNDIWSNCRLIVPVLQELFTAVVCRT